MKIDKLLLFIIHFSVLAWIDLEQAKIANMELNKIYKRKPILKNVFILSCQSILSFK